MGASYAAAWTAVMTSRPHGGPDLVVAPLEGLWWSEDHAVFTAGAEDSWCWTMLLGLPDGAADAMVDAETAGARAEKGALAQRPRPAPHGPRRPVQPLAP